MAHHLRKKDFVTHGHIFPHAQTILSSEWKSRAFNWEMVEPITRGEKLIMSKTI